MTESDDSAPVEIARAPNEIMAGMWRSWLEDEGIVVMVKVGGPGSAYFSTFGSEHILYVREEDAERARELLDESTALDEADGYEVDDEEE